MQVSIVIVHYANLAILFNCLYSIYKTRSKLVKEVIVVDNDENKVIKNKVLARFSQVIYVSAKGNIGYGGGVNLGVKQCSSEYIFVLNPDTEIFPNTVAKLLSVFNKNKEVTVVAPGLVNEKLQPYTQVGSSELTPVRGIFALSFLNKLFPNNYISKKYFMDYIPKKGVVEVDVVPGSAFIMRKEVFEKIGGFDPNFFLYFEESDLCKRVRDLGYKIYINFDAPIIHLWRGSTSDSPRIKKIFEKSRFYYFKKHFGIFNALLVEVFARFSKSLTIFTVIFASGVFLRFYRLQENLVFHGELGSNYLAIKNFIDLRKIPLLGPPTSHPWINFGPLFYWLFIPIMYFGKFGPLVGAYAMAFFSSLLIIVHYIFIKKLFNVKIALYSSFLISISPLWLWIAREARFFSLTPFFFYPFYFFLTNGNIFWALLILSIGLNFHLSLLIYLPVAFFYIHKKFKIALFGFLLGQIPFLIGSLLTDYKMPIKFLAWLPYRVVANPAAKFRFESFSIWTLILIPVFLFIILKYYKKYRLLCTLFVTGILALIIHGNPPSHYFLPLYPIFTILPAIFLSDVDISKIFRYLLFFIVLIPTFTLFRPFGWFYQDQTKISDDYHVPYELQQKATAVILEDAHGVKFNLKRQGLFDNFSEDFSQNYRYLLWLGGNEPIVDSNLIYTICEMDCIFDNYDNVWNIKNLTIFKSHK